MIDYIKVFVKHSNTAHLTNLYESGVFEKKKDDVNTSSGLVKEVFVYKGLKIAPIKGGFYLSGSIHKYHSIINGIATQEQIKQHNGNNSYLFTFEQYKDTLHNLCQVLDTTPESCNVQNIEIGLNNEVDFDPLKLLRGLLFHKSNFDPSISHNGQYYQYVHNDFILKLYDKGKQYEANKYIFRVEVKIIKMRKLTKSDIHINTLADINEDTLKKSFEVLFNEFQEVVYYDDTIRENELTVKERQKIELLKNKENWRNMERMEKSRNKDFLQKFILQNSDNLKNQTNVEMYKNYNAVIDANVKNVTNSPPPLEQLENKNVTNSPTLKDEAKNKNVTNSPTLKDEAKNKNVTNSPFNYRVNLSQSENGEYSDAYTKVFNQEIKTDHLKDKYNPYNRSYKVCPVTLMSLELEGEKSKYIRTKTILHLKKYFPKEYSMICSLLIPHSGYKPNREDNIISHLCKQVRNRYNTHKKHIDADKRTPLYRQAVLDFENSDKKTTK